MPKAPFSDVLQYLRRVCAAHEARDLSDRQLLNRFITHHEDAAFTVLVQRHGPMVLAVCQRVLGDSHDAEDCLQATFMVLVRRAPSLRLKASLATWLYAVALRVASKARARAASQRIRERRVEPMPQRELLDELTWQELRGVLDAEIAKLPEKYRAPLVLCHLEGKTHDQAARELGWPRNTLTARIGQARELLRQRLVRRGITLSAGMLATALCEKVCAAPLGAVLVIKTVKAAASMAAGKAVAAGFASAQAVALAEKTAVGAAVNLKLIILSVSIGVALGGAGMAGYKMSGPDQQTAKAALAPKQPTMGDDKSAQSKKEVPPSADLLGDPLPPGAVARLGTLRLKHLSREFEQQGVPFDMTMVLVGNAQFVPDGTKLVTWASGHGGGVSCWDVQTGKKIAGPWVNGYYRTMALSPDGKRMAAAGIYNSKDAADITVWDLATGTVVRSLGINDVVDAMAFSSDDKTLIVASGSTVRWLNVASGKEEWSWQPFVGEARVIDGENVTKRLVHPVFSPDGKFVAVRPMWRSTDPDFKSKIASLAKEGSEAAVLNLETRQVQWSTRGKPPISAVTFAFSGDSRWIALSMTPGEVQLRLTASGEAVQIPAIPPDLLGKSRITSLALSVDGSKMAFGSVNSLIVLWEKVDAQKFRKTTARFTQMWGNSVASLAFSADGKMLVAGADFDVQLFDVTTLKEFTPWPGHRGWVDYLSFSNDGKTLLSGSASLNLQPQEVVTWDVATWKCMEISSTRTPKFPNIGSPSPEQDFFTGRDGEDRLRIYDMRTGKFSGKLSAPDKQDVTAVGFFLTGGRFYVLNENDLKGAHFMGFYRSPSGELICRLPAISLKNGQMSGRPVAASADSRLIAVYGDDLVIHLYDTANGKEFKKLGEPSDEDKLMRNSTAVYVNAHLAFSPDGKYLASWSPRDALLSIWDVARGKLLTRLNDDVERIVSQVHFAWSADSRMLAVSRTSTENDPSLKPRIQLWEMATMQMRREFQGHHLPVRVLAFSPDGRWLASGSADSTILVWNVSGS
jgi:RNA polymerase sigma factor (sigma-70 family)